jgi:hypothetical protein
MRRVPLSPTRAAEAPQTWGIIIGKALTDPVWFLITDWFALLLKRRGFTLEKR